MKVRTLRQWAEPEIQGQPLVWHEPGEVTDIDTAAVFDLEDLIANGTVERSADIPTLANSPIAVEVTEDEGETVTPPQRFGRRAKAAPEGEGE
jgi:hypothetical protein